MSWLLLCHDLLAGGPAAAAARLDASEVTTVLQPWMRPWVLAQMAEAHVELGHEAEGQELLHAAFECAKGSDTCFWLLESIVRARLLITQKRWNGAAEQLEAASDGPPGPVPLRRSASTVRVRLGTCWSRGALEAQEQWEDALVIFQRLGARPYIERTQRALALI